MKIRLAKKLRKLLFPIDELYLGDADDKKAKILDIYCLSDDPDYLKIEVIRLDTDEHELYVPKADYEARLKADMVAMLKEIKSEIEENEDNCDGGVLVDCVAIECVKIIQEKIDALRGNENDKTTDNQQS